MSELLSAYKYVLCLSDFICQQIIKFCLCQVSVNCWTIVITMCTSGGPTSHSVMPINSIWWLYIEVVRGTRVLLKRKLTVSQILYFKMMAPNSAVCLKKNDFSARTLATLFTRYSQFKLKVTLLFFLYNPF